MTAIAVPIKRPDRLKTWRLATFAVAWLALAWAILDVRMMVIFHLPLTSDANDYWMAWHGPLYDTAVSLTLAHFNYSPVAALAFWPLSQLPQTAFLVLWTSLGTAAYVWLLAPLPLATRLPAIAAGFLFSLNGNIDWLLALVAVFGLRWPSLWLIALFTKVAPFIGFVWFAIRGEWRRVAQSGADLGPGGRLDRDQPGVAPGCMAHLDRDARDARPGGGRDAHVQLADAADPLVLAAGGRDHPRLDGGPSQSAGPACVRARALPAGLASVGPRDPGGGAAAV